MNSPVSSEDVGCCLAFRSPLSSDLMLNSVFPKTLGEQWALPLCSQSLWLLEWPEWSHHSGRWSPSWRLQGETHNVCLRAVQDKAGLQTWYLSSLRMGKGEKWKCGVPYSHMSVWLDWTVLWGKCCAFAVVAHVQYGSLCWVVEM